MSPMLKRINQETNKHDNLICIACGIVLAVLTVSFFI